MQVIFPHAVEALVVATGAGQFWPAVVEVVPPGHQGFVVVLAKFMPVANHQVGFKGAGDFLGGGDFTVGKDVALNPGVGECAGDAVADGMQQHKAIGAEQVRGMGKIFVIVLWPDMFEHAHRDNLVKAAGEIAIVHQRKFNGQAGAALPGQGQLLARDGDAKDFGTIVPGSVGRQAAPAAAYVELAFAGLQLQLAADHVELGQLGLFQSVGVGPVAAAV